MRTKFHKGMSVTVMGKNFKSKKMAMFAMFREGYSIASITKTLDVERRNVLWTLRTVRKTAQYDPAVIVKFVSRNFGTI